MTNPSASAGGASATRVLLLDLKAGTPAWALPDDVAARLSAAAPPGWEARIVRAPTSSDGDGGQGPSEEVLREIADAEAYVGFGMSRPLLAAAPRLRWIQSASAGVRALLFPELLASDVVVTNAAGVYAEPIAEHVVGAVLHFVRGFDVAIARQREGRWDKGPFTDPEHPDYARPREVGECRVLVVGAGGIGTAVATRLSAFGATCVGVRRRPELGVPEGFAAVIGSDGLDGELPRADVVVLAAPYTGETRGLLDRRRLALLPGGAIVVNVGRGALVDEPALIEALVAGRLRGAALDVFAREPLPADSPLWGLRTVLATPHVSGVSPRRFWERFTALVADNWGRWARGEPLRNQVDTDAGY